jgi:WD40 repeat protein
VYVWDPITNQMIDPLDDVRAATWAGPPSRLAVIFTDGTAGFYDLTTQSRVEGITLELAGHPVVTFTSLDRTRLSLGHAEGQIQTFNSTTGAQIGPTIEPGGSVGSVSATTDGSRIVATSFHDSAWKMTIHDATTGQQLGHVPEVETASVGPDGTLVGSNLAGEIT